MVILPVVILAMSEGDDRSYMEWLYEQHRDAQRIIQWKRVPGTEDEPL